MIELGALADIPTQGARVVKTANGRVAPFRTAADQVFALEDRCSHKCGPLSECIVHGGRRPVRCRTRCSTCTSPSFRVRMRSCSTGFLP